MLPPGLPSIQDQNTSKLIMYTFYKMTDRYSRGVAPADITRYLRYKFGNVWKVNVLKNKVEDTLAFSEALGFLHRIGEKYITHEASRRGRRHCCKLKRLRPKRRY